VLLFAFGGVNNFALHDQFRLNQRDYATAVRMIERLEADPAFAPSRPLAVVGSLRHYPLRFFTSRDGSDVNVSALLQPWSKASLLREVSGYTLPDAAPADLARAADQLGCRSVAFTYNDPTIFWEYAADVADACHEHGVRAISVTAGYMCPQPRAEFYRHIDAANVDLKAFTEDFYHRVCVGHLADVLDTLVYLHHETDVWLEVTTLLIPGLNDSSQEIDQLSRWMMDNLGPDVPLHFTAFRPEYRLLSRERTPLATLQQARRIAKSNGLNYVYVGNISDVEGASTTCPACHKPVIERDRYRILSYALTTDGACQACGTRVPGRFGESPQIATPRPH